MAIEGKAKMMPHGIYEYEGEKYLYDIGSTADDQPRFTFCGNRWDTDLHQAWLKTYGPDVDWVGALNQVNRGK